MPSKVPVQSDHIILLESVRKYWTLIALTIALSLLSAVFEGFSIGMLIPFLQNLDDTSTQAFQTGWAWFDHWILGVGAPQLERMYRICAIILVATWLRSVLSYLSTIYGMEGRVLIVEDLRMRIVGQLQALSLRFFAKTRSGEIINTLTNELTSVGSGLSVMVTVITVGFLLLIYLTFMVWISWQLTFFILVFFGLLSLGLTSLIRRIRRIGKWIPRANGQFTSTASEFISGIRTVKAFNMQAFEQARLHRATTELSRAVIETGKRVFKVQPLSQAVVGTALIGTILLATQFYVLNGKLDMALLLVFLFALLRLMPIVHQLNSQRGKWAGLRASVTNVTDLLRRDNKPYLRDGTRAVGPFREAIVFQAVSFAYEPEESVLRDINLRVECGKMIAIVGASGSGKSTLVDLIPRFYDPTEGRILLDGEDLRTFTLHSLRKKIAVVSQDTFIFNDTVGANIAYGAPEASLDRIVDAAGKANALEFIEPLPEGFDTVLGDRGVRLSGGQRQRLAIARALLRDPEILILDEATSALDSVSEKLVQQSLEHLMQGRTVIAIAHRLSTLEGADWVVVLEHGKIVEQGTYEQLLAQKGQLWEYHSVQFQLAS